MNFFDEFFVNILQNLGISRNWFRNRNRNRKICPGSTAPPSENQLILRRNYYPSTDQITQSNAFIAPRSG